MIEAVELEKRIATLKAENAELVEHIALRKAESGELVATITHLEAEKAELVAGLRNAAHVLKTVEVFVTTREKINHPTGVAWFAEERAAAEALLFKLEGAE